MNRYEYTDIVKTDIGKRVFDISTLPVFEPRDTDLYIITNNADRLDLLASQYYNDVTMWAIIAIANSEYYTGGFNLPAGIRIRIPYPMTATDISAMLAAAEKNK